jgi:hypothetical protein
MRTRNYASLIFGVLASTALLVLPGTSAFADTSSPVTCKDGTTSPHGGRGACSGHGGIDKAATAAAAGGGAGGAAASGSSKASGTSGSSSASGGSSASGAASSSAAPASSTPTTSKSPPASQAPAPGGGPGMVWVNTASKVYHCPSDRYYGKTKKGEYMTEADAKAKGNRPDHNKPCS